MFVLQPTKDQNRKLYLWFSFAFYQFVKWRIYQLLYGCVNGFSDNCPQGKLPPALTLILTLTQNLTLTEGQFSGNCPDTV